MAGTSDNGVPEPTGDGQYFGPRAHDPEPVHEHDPADVTRTRFLSGVALAAGGVMGAAILVPVVGFAVVDPLKEEEFRWVDAGLASDLLKGLPPFTDANVPVGGVSSTAISGPAAESDRRVFIVSALKKGKTKADWKSLTGDDFELLAIWNRCAHLGCPVKEGGGVYACPCHGGAYNERGLVTSGPPPRPLDRFDIKLTDGKRDIPLAEHVKTPSPKHKVLIGKAYSVDSQERPYKLHLPGEPVDGVLSNLYPL